VGGSVGQEQQQQQQPTPADMNEPPPRATSGNTPVAQWLTEVGLGDIKDAVCQLGVETAADLQFLFEEDIDSIVSLGAADKQRLKAAVARMKQGVGGSVGQDQQQQQQQPTPADMNEPPPPATSGDTPVAQWLVEVGLGHLGDEVHQLGAETAADLKLLDEEDIDSELGDQPRLKAAIAQIDTEGQLPPTTRQMRSVNVTLPKGVKAGQKIKVTVRVEGKMIPVVVQVPNGYVPGSQLKVEVPIQ